MTEPTEHDAGTRVGEDEFECALALLEVVPLVMRFIRSEKRRHRTDLSVTQFRALAFVNRHEGASLSDVAEFVGLSLPSMSKMIDGLVTRKLIIRQPSPSDRRRMALVLSRRGRSILEKARQATQTRLAEMVIALSPLERKIVVEAMQALRPVFTTGREAEVAGPESRLD